MLTSCVLYIMKPILHFPIVVLLVFAISDPCLALRSIGLVSKEQAKEMGIEVRATPAGPENAWIELKLKPEGKLKDFHHVELEIRDGKKSVVSWCPLRGRLESGKVVVRFMASRAYISKIILTLVYGDMEDLGDELHLKDFIEEKKIG